MSYKFSGHETFHCRPIWLKKGFDYANENRLFNDENALIELGVGKNMVASIKFWLRAFGFYNSNNNELEGLSQDLLNDNGFDPYLEDDATLYLLHYLLVKNRFISSIYYLTFIKFSKEKLEFTTDQLTQFIIRECSKEEIEINDKTLNNDIKVFFKNYIPSIEKKNGIEDNYSGLFYDLRFIAKIKTEDADSKYIFNLNDGKHLPEAIFLYVLLDVFPNRTSISIQEIRDNVSSIFLMERQGTHTMMERLEDAYPGITFKDDGGRQELQMKENLQKLEVLNSYYERV